MKGFESMCLHRIHTHDCWCCACIGTGGSEVKIMLSSHVIVLSERSFIFSKKQNGNFEGFLIMLGFFFIILSAMTGNYIFVSLDHRSKTSVEIPLVVLNLLFLHKVGVTTVVWVCILSSDIFIFVILVLSCMKTNAFHYFEK